jgi:hypothetical protein
LDACLKKALGVPFITGTFTVSGVVANHRGDVLCRPWFSAFRQVTAEHVGRAFLSQFFASPPERPNDKQ